MDAVLLASLAELPRALETVVVCGILLELTLAIKASPPEKRITQDFVELYPSAKFRLAAPQVLIVGETLDGFVERCLKFKPRSARKSPRGVKHLAVHLSADQTFEDAEKAVTINTSEGGYFVYSSREWIIGSRVWLRFPGDKVAVRGTVRAFRPWGNNQSLPGIGIEVETKREGIG
jgi:hypothetical protein